MAKRKLEGLTKNQKLALIGGAAVIVIVLAFTLLFGNQQLANSQDFSDYLYSSNKSAIIMDVRNSPDTTQNSIVMQCGVNLIADGFFVKTHKDLVVYACDNKGCISSTAMEALNATNESQEDISEFIVPFDEVLSDMRGRAYFHIKYADEEKKNFHPTYVEVFVNSSTNPAECKLDIKQN